MESNINSEYFGLNIKAEIFLIIIAVFFSLFIFRQLKKKRLDEKYTLLWLLIAVLIIALPILSPVLDKIAFLFGFYYPPNLLFVIVILVFLVKILYYSMELTKLNRQNHLFAQELAIQGNEIKKLKKKIADLQ